MYQDITLRYEDSIARIQLNRPECLNAIRVQTYQELISAFQEADKSELCNIILIEGSGGRFTAGNDLSDLIGDQLDAVMAGVQGIFDTVSQLEKPLLAVVDGVAVGIGVTLLLHCDMVIAGEKTRFRLPFTNLGVCPEGGSSALLSRAVGPKVASELLLTGRFFSADEAKSWGLVNTVVASEDLESTTSETLKILNAQPVDALIATKREIRRQAGLDVSRIVSEELVAFQALLRQESTQARIQSFLKR